MWHVDVAAANSPTWECSTVKKNFCEEERQNRMKGQTRREEIIRILQESEGPVPGTELAERLNVSRQVIVQDMALLRAQRMQILSTYKGYFLDAAVKEQYVRIFRVHHDTEHTLDELQLIVDYGGKVLDVFVEHPLYGQIRADLMIANRMEAKQFVEQMEAHEAHPLKLLTDDCHYHTVVAGSEEQLDLIEQELKMRGYLQE